VGILFLEKKENEEIILRQNRELESMMLKQSRLAQMGEILNMVAHQWRQPLTNLLLINEILVYRYREGEINDEEIDEFQKESTFQIKQMSKTIDDFKDFFHPRKEKVKFSLNDVVENLLYIIKPIFRESNIHININKEENLYLYGYPNEMSQALLNLLYNSKDAFIERDIKERYINIVLEKKQNQILLIVQDNAGGIPKDIIENIFKPYFSTKNNQGTGLGLSISKIIIEKHMEGSLFVENIKEGTAFIMRFKLKE